MKVLHFIRLFCLIVLLILGGENTQGRSFTPNERTGDASVPDKLVTVNVGKVKVRTYNPVTITDLEYSTNFYFVARNTSNKTLTLKMTSLEKIKASLPNWVFHFYYFQPESMEIPPKQEKTFEYILTNEGTGTVKLPFTFKVEETGEQKTIKLNVRSVNSPSISELPLLSEVKGKVMSSSGQPIEDARVSIYMYNGRTEFSERTDSEGNFSRLVPSQADVEKTFGPRTLPYHSLGFFIVVEADGYELGYKDGIQPKNPDSVTCDFSLTPVTKSSYTEIGKLMTNGVHGYFWLYPEKTFNEVAAVQGRHPTALQQPGHIMMADTSGNRKWRLDTNDECWGFDLKKNRIAAGCHDGMVYVTDLDGNILLKVDTQAMNREVEIDPKGKKLFTGPYMGEDAALLNIQRNNVIWTYKDPNDWLRNSRFSPNGKRIIAGFSSGTLVMLSNKGQILWKNYIGEFPMVLEIDKRYNVYAAGKNRELFSYDAKGNLRWRRRIGNHVVTAGSNNMSRKGDLILCGTVGGFLYAFNNDGKILWQRKMSESAILQGHNALDVTPNGRHIAVGTAGETGSVILYDRKGTLLWSKRFTDRRGSSAYDHNQTGAITVAVSDDASMIAAGFGDSVIRFFKRN